MALLTGRSYSEISQAPSLFSQDFLGVYSQESLCNKPAECLQIQFTIEAYWIAVIILKKLF